MSDSADLALLTLEVEAEGDTAVVLCKGRLMSNTSALLLTPVSQLLTDNQHVVLDLSELTQMDSTGLGALVRLYVSAKRQGRVLELRNLGAKVRDLLILTNLISVFSVAGEHGVGIH